MQRKISGDVFLITISMVVKLYQLSSHNGTSIRIIVTEEMSNFLVGSIGRRDGLSNISNIASRSPLVISSSNIGI